MDVHGVYVTLDLESDREEQYGISWEGITVHLPRSGAIAVRVRSGQAKTAHRFLSNWRVKSAWTFGPESVHREFSKQMGCRFAPRPQSTVVLTVTSKTYLQVSSAGSSDSNPCSLFRTTASPLAR